MAKKVGVITVHGMGDTKNINNKKHFYAKKLLREVKERLSLVEYKSIAWGHVYYQDILQTNQEAYFRRIRSKVQWDKLRKFMLFGFCDAATLESQKSGSDSPYFLAQNNILETFQSVYSELEEDAPVIVIAQSLGGQVISNYLWDADENTAPVNGVWSDPPAFSSIGEEEFCRGHKITRLYTTGCNIPIFVAGRDYEDIEAISPVHPEFEWHNYYDDDDVLGFPLKQLSVSYESLVQDHVVRSGGLGSFTPLSHREYWHDGEVIRPLVKDISKALSDQP